MNAQQLHDFIIKPTLEYMGGNYNTVESRFLLLCTAAIESNCGHFIKQVNGPALGIWQIEPDTHDDILDNCDALKGDIFSRRIRALMVSPLNSIDHDLQVSPMYACAMARLKYAMDPKALPKYTGKQEFDLPAFYEVYKRVYNTANGASTFDKWCSAINKHGVLGVSL